MVNSRWLEEIEAINSIHRLYRPESWRERIHYVFRFHDCTFECVARSYKVETHCTSMRALLGLMVERPRWMGESKPASYLPSEKERKDMGKKEETVYYKPGICFRHSVNWTKGFAR